MAISIPYQVKKYFWGDDLSQLNWQNHKEYITQTLLNKGDEKALAWLFKTAGYDEIKTMLPKLKLEPKSLNFWRIYFS